LNLRAAPTRVPLASLGAYFFSVIPRRGDLVILRAVTITNRILLQLAVAAALVIVVATGATYRLVHGEAERQGLNHLGDYVAERARVEETKFAQVQENLEMVRAQALRRFAAPIPADFRKQWDEWFERFPDGAWRSRRKFSDGRKWSTLWLHKDAKLTPELQTQILRANNICNDLLQGWVDSFPSLYFLFPCQANMGFDPRIPNWVWDTPADYDNNGIEAVRNANPENNPGRRIVWNSVLEEPTSHNPYIAVLLPIDLDGTNVATVGHDIHALQLLDDSTRSSLKGATHFIFREDGRLIAHRERMPQILAAKGLLTMQGSDDPALRSLYTAARKRPERRFAGYDPVSHSYYAVSRLAGPEWFFMTTMPGAELQQRAFQSAQWVLWSGLLSLALMLGFLATILRRQIARPLAELARATRQMSAGETTARAVVPGRDELGALAGSFNEMAGRVASRDAELRALNQTLEQRVAERTNKLRESEERFSKAFQASPALIALTRVVDGTFVAANEAFYKITGFTEAEVIGRRSLDLKIYAVPEQREEYVRMIREKGSVRDREHLLQTKDGTLRTVLVSGEALELDGQPHLLTVGLDITGRKQAEVETVKALAREKELSELKSNFVSMVSHEFRTPLGVIMSAAEILQRYFDRLPAEKRGRHLEMIFRSTRNLAALMEEVLLLGKVEEGRMQFTPAPIDLESFCRSLADEILSATQAACPIRFSSAAPLDGAVGDESLLRHILTNLLSNAVKYSEPGTPVEFLAGRVGAEAVFTVRDHGIGIPLEDQPRIFNSFSRGRNVGERPGTGLGLVIVQRCVQLHGGDIRLESTPGQGTTMVVRLPVFGEVERSLS
jgi:PAS domain S-box-containing protein